MKPVPVTERPLSDGASGGLSEYRAEADDGMWVSCVSVSHVRMTASVHRFDGYVSLVMTNPYGDIRACVERPLVAA